MTIPNNLWIKADGAPTALPSSDTDASGLPWDDLAHNEEGRTACGWTPAPPYPDYDASSQHPVWLDGAWTLEDNPPAPYVARNLSHKEFLDLWTVAEQGALIGLQKSVDQMSASDFAANPTAQATAIVFKQFDTSSMIDLNHPQTIYAVQSVIAPQIGASAERAAAVLAGQDPPTS